MKSLSFLPTAVKDLLNQNFISQQIKSASSLPTAVKDLLKKNFISQQIKSASFLPSSLSMAVTEMLRQKFLAGRPEEMILLLIESIFPYYQVYQFGSGKSSFNNYHIINQNLHFRMKVCVLWTFASFQEFQPMFCRKNICDYLFCKLNLCNKYLSNS